MRVQFWRCSLSMHSDDESRAEGSAGLPALLKRVAKGRSAPRRTPRRGLRKANSARSPRPSPPMGARETTTRKAPHPGPLPSAERENVPAGLWWKIIALLLLLTTNLSAVIRLDVFVGYDGI